MLQGPGHSLEASLIQFYLGVYCCYFSVQGLKLQVWTSTLPPCRSIPLSSLTQFQKYKKEVVSSPLLPLALQITGKNCRWLPSPLLLASEPSCAIGSESGQGRVKAMKRGREKGEDTKRAKPPKTPLPPLRLVLLPLIMAQKKLVEFLYL